MPGSSPAKGPARNGVAFLLPGEPTHIDNMTGQVFDDASLYEYRDRRARIFPSSGGSQSLCSLNLTNT
jgi:hypothetical protein